MLNINSAIQISQMPNKMYVTTAADENGNYAQIEVSGDDLKKLINDDSKLASMYDYRFYPNLKKPVSSETMTMYMKALNGIFPKGIKYDGNMPKGFLDRENTRFEIKGNKKGTVVVVNKVTTDPKSGKETEEEVLGIQNFAIQE